MSNNKYEIGLLRATSLVAGNMIGSGVLLAPAILAPYGSLSIMGWILTTCGALALAVAFSYLSRWIPKSGGPYTFVKQVFGDFIGFQMAWGYWISVWCGSVSLLVGGLQYLSILCPVLVANKLFCISLCITIVALFTFINMRGLKESTFWETVIVAIKIIPLVSIAFIGIFFVDFSNVFNIATEVSGDNFTIFSNMAPVLLWGFIGLESATIPANSVKNPSKTIPIATISGVLITAAVYICGAIVITGLIPHGELLVSNAPYVDSGKRIFGHFGEVVMIITGTIGIYGSLNGWTLVQGQVPYAAAKEGLFPKYFLKTNKYGAPNGIWIGSLLMVVIFLLTYQPSLVKHVQTLIEVSVLAMLLPYFYSAIAFCYIAVCKRNELSSLEKILSVIVGCVSILYTFLAIIGSGMHMIFLSTIMLLISVPFYCFIKD